MPGRFGSSGEQYRFGFQNQEKDDEIHGSGNSISFKYRVEDTRIGRFLSLDPLAAKYPYNSPYAFSENRVIDGVELEGLEVVLVHLNGRVSIPLNPMFIGITHSISYGMAVNLDDGRGMFYKTKSAGVQGGIFGGLGVEFGFFPTANIENVKGYGFSLGTSMAISSAGGIPVGPEGTLALNLTIPTNDQGKPNKKDIYNINKYRLGGTVAPGVLGYAAGGTFYSDFSYTEPIKEFDINREDIVVYLKEFYNNYFSQENKEEMSYKKFYDSFLMLHSEAIEELEKKGSSNSPKK